MQKTTQDRHTPLAMAHLMGRPTESKDEEPVRFRPQADRRRIQALANGAPDRRTKRAASAATDEGADAINGTAKPGSSNIGQDK